MKYSEFDTLNTEDKGKIVGNWNPNKPYIDSDLKLEIVNAFMSSTKWIGLQYGIANFGWNIYMIFIVVEKSNTRIPKTFSGLPVNKGVVQNKIDENNYIVKFSYSGKATKTLSDKIVIT